MLHLLAANYDWHHHVTPKSEEIKVFATIFPMVRHIPVKTMFGSTPD